jgi:hypothetical protein
LSQFHVITYCYYYYFLVTVIIIIICEARIQNHYFQYVMLFIENIYLRQMLTPIIILYSINYIYELDNINASL